MAVRFGTCRDCGAETRSGVRGRIPERCTSCTPATATRPCVECSRPALRYKQRCDFCATDWVEYRACASCGSRFWAEDRRTTFCSKQCCRKVHKQQSGRTRRTWARQNGPREAFTIQALYDRGEHCCHLCGYVVQAHERPEIDHVVPLSRGGTHTLDNVRLAHGICNARRGDRLAPIYTLV